MILFQAAKTGDRLLEDKMERLKYVETFKFEFTKDV